MLLMLSVFPNCKINPRPVCLSLRNCEGTWKVLAESSYKSTQLGKGTKHCTTQIIVLLFLLPFSVAIGICTMLSVTAGVGGGEAGSPREHHMF